jgi:hypothetical protein
VTTLSVVTVLRTVSDKLTRDSAARLQDAYYRMSKTVECRSVPTTQRRR